MPTVFIRRARISGCSSSPPSPAPPPADSVSCRAPRSRISRTVTSPGASTGAVSAKGSAVSNRSIRNSATRRAAAASRHTLGELRVLGFVDLAPRAAAEESDHPETAGKEIARTEDRRRLPVLAGLLRRRRARGDVEEAGRLGVGGKQLLDLAPQIGVAGAGFGQVLPAPVGLAVQSGIEELFDALPTSRIEVAHRRG